MPFLKFENPRTCLGVSPLNIQRAVQPRLVMFGEDSDVEWFMSKTQDETYQMHAENVRFVHTCLHVCVGMGNLVMCMTEAAL